MFFYCADASAQQLRKGDTLAVRFAGAEGKQLVIIDFWNTLCKGCLKSLPKIDSLQVKYKNETAMYLVSGEDSLTVERFFAVRKSIKRPRVNYICGDTSLKKKFPHQFVPHIVWLSPAGKVLGISENITDENIQAYLRDGEVDIQPIVQQVSIDRKRFFHDSPADTTLLYHSYLRRMIDTIYAAESFSRINKQVNRILMHKKSKVDLLCAAFGEGRDKFSLSKKNVLLEVKDPAGYIPPADPKVYKRWAVANLYLYDLMVAPSSAPGIFRMMQDDISRLFLLNATVEKRELLCYVLRMDGDDKIATKGGSRLNLQRKPPADSLWIIQNMPFKDFFGLLSGSFRLKGIELIDETGYNQPVDITISAEIAERIDIEAVRKDLKRYNLVLEERRCMVEILVIREK